MLSAHARRQKSSDAVGRRLCVCAGRWRSGSPSRCCSCVWVRPRYLPGGLGGRRALRAAPCARDGDWEEAGPGPRRRAGFAPSSPFVPRTRRARCASRSPHLPIPGKAGSPVTCSALSESLGPLAFAQVSSRVPSPTQPTRGAASPLPGRALQARGAPRLQRPPHKPGPFLALA